MTPRAGTAALMVTEAETPRFDGADTVALFDGHRGAPSKTREAYADGLGVNGR